MRVHTWGLAGTAAVLGLDVAIKAPPELMLLTQPLPQLEQLLMILSVASEIFVCVTTQHTGASNPEQRQSLLSLKADISEYRLGDSVATQ